MRPVNKAGQLAGTSMTAQSIFEVVERYREKLGIRVASNDLRRTFAKLAHKSHAPLEQIQLSLGHASVRVLPTRRAGCQVACLQVEWKAGAPLWTSRCRPI